MVSSSMPWVKLYTEMLDDPKIGRLSPALRWRFIEMILLAGECDADGYLTGLSIEDMAWRLRTTQAELENDLVALAEAGLMLNDGGVWLVVNFAKRQGRPQSTKRQQWADAQKRQRGQTGDNESLEHGGKGIIYDTDMSQNGVITPDKIKTKSQNREDQEVEGELNGAKAPGVPPTPTKPKRVTSDPRSKHPAILCIKGITRHYPPLELYDDLIRILGDSPDGKKLFECRKEWVKRGHNSNGWAWVLEWYSGGVPISGKQNGSRPPSHDATHDTLARMRKELTDNGE